MRKSENKIEIILFCLSTWPLKYWEIIEIENKNCQDTHVNTRK